MKNILMHLNTGMTDATCTISDAVTSDTFNKTYYYDQYLSL